MTDLIEIKVPDVGGDEVEVIEIIAQVGDNLEVEDSLVTVETDKATMDIPAPVAGVLKELKVKVGDKLNQDDLLALVAASEGADASAQADEPASVAEEAAEEPVMEAAEDAKAQSGNEVATETKSEVITITVPDLGEDGPVDVIDLLVKVGDTLEVESGIITVETDKATMDVPSTHAGVVKSIQVKVGDQVSQGSALIELETQAEVKAAPAAEEAAPVAQTAAEKTAPAAQAEAPTAPVSTAQTGVKTVEGKLPHASPAVRRLARELGVDLTQVGGTGAKGRILKEDVQAFVKTQLSEAKSGSKASAGGGLQVLAQPKVDFARFGEIEVQDLTRIQKISGPNLHRNWVTIPHVTQFDEADITELEAFRKSENEQLARRKADVKFTPLVFIMKAVAKALLEFPTFNASLHENGEQLILKKYVHIGIAVDTPNGLVVPVIRDVDQKGIVELSYELAEISTKAREGKLKPADMQGGCFSISSLGGIGGTAFTPIVNAPEVAILGVSRSEMKPVWNGKEFIPRLKLPLSLSYDHRVIDGALAARFSVYLTEVLADLRKIIL